jgi:hypothetical protein
MLASITVVSLVVTIVIVATNIVIVATATTNPPWNPTPSSQTTIVELRMPNLSHHHGTVQPQSEHRGVGGETLAAAHWVAMGNNSWLEDGTASSCPWGWLGNTSLIGETLVVAMTV